MKKGTLCMVILSSLVLSLTWGMALPVTAAEVWEVDGDGGYDSTTIQGAFNMASDGDRIIVRDGTYNEHVLVNKEVTITAEKDHSPVVDGGGSGVCFKICRGGGMIEVGIKNFKIRNADQESGYWEIPRRIVI
jgi:nitrous oxidase accessory protein NosD